MFDWFKNTIIKLSLAFKQSAEQKTPKPPSPEPALQRPKYISVPLQDLIIAFKPYLSLQYIENNPDGMNGLQTAVFRASEDIDSVISEKLHTDLFDLCESFDDIIMKLDSVTPDTHIIHLRTETLEDLRDSKRLIYLAAQEHGNLKEMEWQAFLSYYQNPHEDRIPINYNEIQLIQTKAYKLLSLSRSIDKFINAYDPSAMNDHNSNPLSPTTEKKPTYQNRAVGPYTNGRRPF